MNLVFIQLKQVVKIESMNEIEYDIVEFDKEHGNICVLDDDGRVSIQMKPEYVKLIIDYFNAFILLKRKCKGSFMIEEGKLKMSLKFYDNEFCLGGTLGGNLYHYFDIESITLKDWEEIKKLIESVIPTVRNVVKQSWEESERGWGTRPDGYSLHLTDEDAKQYIKEYQDSQPDGPAPDEYSRPYRSTKIIEVDEKTYQEIKNSKNGIRRWR